MADENTTTEVANNGQAAPKPVDNAFGQIDATEAPSATATNAEPVPADTGDANPQDDQIQNPERYYRAQAEKYARLLEKTEAQLNAASQKLKERESAEDAAIRAEYEALKAEVVASKAEAERERLNALKLRVGQQHGLDAELALRLVGDDEAALSEDAQKIAAKVTPVNQQRKPSTANPANTDGRPVWGKLDPWTGN